MQEQMMANPDMMQGMMKAQLGGVLPQVRSSSVVISLNQEELYHSFECSSYAAYACEVHRIIQALMILFQLKCQIVSAADWHGGICKLLLFWLYFGQDTFCFEPKVSHDAPGTNGFSLPFLYSGPFMSKNELSAEAVPAAIPSIPALTYFVNKSYLPALSIFVDVVMKCY